MRKGCDEGKKGGGGGEKRKDDENSGQYNIARSRPREHRPLESLRLDPIILLIPQARNLYFTIFQNQVNTKETMII